MKYLIFGVIFIIVLTIILLLVNHFDRQKHIIINLQKHRF
jgi:hypothetical protein